MIFKCSNKSGISNKKQIRNQAKQKKKKKNKGKNDLVVNGHSM